MDRSPIEQSFLNTVQFYHRELMLIDKGEKATSHLKDRQRKALVKAGVLNRVYGRGGCRLRLSVKAKRVLRDLGHVPQ
ncbi:hypothetical protein JXL21_10615 [Candidatus Bathyarchaeota archaeon]|nr:hypothetical protein [Candidatus Bathyarchaeota archaeon]